MTKSRLGKRAGAWLWLLLALLGLVACGGGGAGSEPAATAPTITAQPVDQQVVAGASALFTVAIEGADASFQWQRSMDGGQTWSPLAGAGAAVLTLADATTADDGSRFRVVVSRGPAGTISSAATLTVVDAVVPASISVQPQSVQVSAGGTATFSVTAAGTGLTYRWQTSPDGTSWTDMAGADSATLTLPGVPLSHNGLAVRVVLSNSAGSLNSNPVTLVVVEAPPASSVPSIISHPVSTSVVAPATAAFTVVVSGIPAPGLQWQRSTDGGINYNDIPGALEANYTAPPTTVADSGTRFRVVARNPEGAAVSADAVLTVSPTPAAPSFDLEPEDASAAPGQRATFSSQASGTPLPAMQWQISVDGGATFANINGATGPTYGLTVEAGDDGHRFRVLATNGVGSRSSRTATLSVIQPPGPLSGRAWTAGQPLATGGFIVGGAGTASIIDDQGRITVLFSRLSIDRIRLHAVRGEPGPAGGSPVFGAPVPLEPGYPGHVASNLLLASSPAGNVVAMWTHVLPCSPGSSSDCVFWFTSRFLPAVGNWEVPTSTTSLAPAGAPSINDAGDIAVLAMPLANANGFFSAAWRRNGQSEFTSHNWPFDFDNGSFTPCKLTMDNAGRLLAVGTLTQPQSTNTDLAVFRGDILTGLGTREIIDIRGAKATCRGAFTNPAGQAVVLWSQDNGTQATVYAGTLDSAEGAWAVRDTGQTPPASGSEITAALGDDGSFIWYAYPRCAALRHASGIWSGPASLPAALCVGTGVYGQPVLARNGLLLSLHPSDGSWLSFDPWLNQVVSPRPTQTSGPGYLLGYQQGMTSLAGTLMLSSNGVGAYVSVNAYDVLPTAAAPNGDSRGINSVWGWYNR